MNLTKVIEFLKMSKSDKMDEKIKQYAKKSEIKKAAMQMKKYDNPLLPDEEFRVKPYRPIKISPTGEKMKEAYDKYWQRIFVDARADRALSIELEEEQRVLDEAIIRARRIGFSDQKGFHYQPFRVHRLPDYDSTPWGFVSIELNNPPEGKVFQVWNGKESGHALKKDGKIYSKIKNITHWYERV